MSEFAKFTLEERVYGKGRKSRFVYGQFPLPEKVIVEDIKSVGGDPHDGDLCEAWIAGYESRSEHNPLPHQFCFDAPPIIQKIKYKNQTRGVVLAYVKNNSIWVGWSIRRLIDKFDPEYATVSARVNSIPLSKFNVSKLPQYFDKNFEEAVRVTVFKVIGRALHYYQQISLSSLDY